MFGRVAIIGVGLIGSSLARKLKNIGAVNHIAGCARDSVKKALELGVIDSAYSEPEECVKDADIIIICTPLSTYSDIAKRISPHMKEGAILTDAGSVKFIPSEKIFASLNHNQQKNFVPGHPIAGTEKSGPESGFAELFEGKKIILTPTPITDKKALDKVKKLWEVVGAEVEIMDARRHDFIFASTSHSIQFLSSSFGLSFNEIDEETKKEIIKNADINFRKFIRLTGSDPVMWRDIYFENLDNLESSLKLFLDNMESLKTALEFDEKKLLAERFENAKEKRMMLHPMLKGKDNTNFRKSDYSNASSSAIIWLDIMPRIISCLLMEGISESEYKYASGAGLHGFSKNIILDGATNVEDIFNVKDEVIFALGKFSAAINDLNLSVKNHNGAKLTEKLSASRMIYQNLS